MANQLPCDICGEEPAVIMMTSLGDGSVMTVGAGCAPGFYGHCALQAMAAGEHKGPATKCQACRRMHEQMTTPVAPIGRDQLNEDETLPEHIADDTSGVAP